MFHNIKSLKIKVTYLRGKCILCSLIHSHIHMPIKTLKTDMSNHTRRVVLPLKINVILKIKPMMNTNFIHLELISIKHKSCFSNILVTPNHFLYFNIQVLSILIIVQY